MNKLFLQFKHELEIDDALENTFMYLNPVHDGDTDEPYERVDRDNPPGQAGRYSRLDFEETWLEDVNTFRLEFEYE